MNLNSLMYLGYFGYLSQIIMVISYASIGVLSYAIWQAYIAHEKKTWMKNLLDRADFSDEVTARLKAAVEPVQSFPLYRLFKFYLALISSVLLIIGLLIVVLPESMGSDLDKILVFVPLIYGLIFYALYKNVFIKNGLFRELTATFLAVGFAVTFTGFFPTYDFTFMRTDITMYIVLTATIFVIQHMRSTVVSYLYMIFVAGAGLAISSMSYGESEWLEFLHLLIWPFAFAILYFWLPRLEEGKRIEMREILFGSLYMVMLIALCFTSTYGLGILALVAMIPGLYLFSKVYFKRGVWYLERPIQTSIVILTVYALMFFSVEDTTMVLGTFSAMFSDFGVMKFLSIILILGFGAYSYFMYKDYFEGKEEQINLPLISFPVLLLLAMLLGNDYRGDILVALAALYIGYSYVQMGLKNRNEIVLSSGIVLVLFTVIIKIAEVIKDELNEKVVFGLFLIFIAGIVGAALFYIRKQWCVTEESDLKSDENEMLIKN
jgi:hypothetical protein